MAVVQDLILHSAAEHIQSRAIILCICRPTFMWTLLAELDHGPQALPAGSSVTLVNNHEFEGGLGAP